MEMTLLAVINLRLIEEHLAQFVARGFQLLALMMRFIVSQGKINSSVGCIH